MFSDHLIYIGRPSVSLLSFHIFDSFPRTTGPNLTQYKASLWEGVF